MGMTRRTLFATAAGAAAMATTRSTSAPTDDPIAELRAALLRLDPSINEVDIIERLAPASTAIIVMAYRR